MAEQEEAVTGRELDEALDDTLRATLKDITAREGVVEEPAPDKPIVETEPVAAAPKIDERPRDATGKFVEKPKEAVAPKGDKPPEPAAPVQAVEPEAPLTTTTGQPIDINRPPSSWKPAAKAAWMTLTPELRQEIHRREGDFLHGGKAQQVDADFGRTIKQTVEPYRMLIEAEGGTPERAIADTLKTAALFRVGQPEQKLQALFQIDQQFCGGALNQLFAKRLQEEVAKATGQPGAQPAPPQPQNFHDPRVDQLLAAQRKQEQDRVAQEERVTNSATQKFLSSKDDKGQPLYPFVDNVLDDMSDRVSSIRRTNPAIGHEEALKQAYEAAVWANPETRAVLISQQQAQAQQSAETLRKVEQAKRANAGNMPRRGALPATEPVGSIEDTIRDTYRRLTG